MASQLFMVLLLVFLEVALSMDNALAIAGIVKHLPSGRRGKALTYGIWGAVGFRIIALFFLQQILTYQWLRFAGAAYLLYLAVKYFVWGDDSEGDEADTKAVSAHFWKIVFMVEITDIAFSADSVLASVTVTDVYWIMVAGGCVGIIAMRLAAGFFATLMQTFPRLEDAAYLLITIAGVRIFIEGLTDFKVPEIAFYAFLLCCFGYGFTKKVSAKVST